MRVAVGCTLGRGIWALRRSAIYQRAVVPVRVEADRFPELPLEVLVGGDLELARAIHSEAVGTR